MECYLEKGPWSVGGGYDGLLVFGEPLPGTGEDTVRTAVKTFVYDTNPGVFYDLRYAAGIGLIYYDDVFVREGVYYARVDGVEYGVSVLPPFVVSSEAEAPEPDAAQALEAWPNPFRERLTVDLTLEARPCWRSWTYSDAWYSSATSGCCSEAVRRLCSTYHGSERESTSSASP